MLGKIQIGGGDVDRSADVFYTALYHALLHPNVFSDSNGQYAGFDGQTHKAAAGHVEYANYSGWDIYRSQVQLAAMVAPQQTSDSIRSMLNQYDQTGQLPKWALNNGETYVMVGDPADADHRRRLRLRRPRLRHRARAVGDAGRGEPAQQHPARPRPST